MTTQRNVMVDQVYTALVNAPNELNPTVGEVLSGLRPICQRNLAGRLQRSAPAPERGQLVLCWVTERH